MNRECRLTDRIISTARPGPREYSLRDSVVHGLALRVQPSGARSWVLRGHLADRARRIHLGDAAELGVDQARSRAHEVLSGRIEPGSAHDATPSPRFEDFADTYQSRRRNRWKPSTRRSNDSYLRTTLIPAFKSKRLGQIQTADVFRWFHSYGSTSPGGANRALSLLKDLFNRAVEWDVLAADHANPCKGIRHTRRPSRGQVLNAEAITRLWQALESEPAYNNDQVDAVRLLLLTGCRVGEILTLRWEDVRPGVLRLRDAKAGPRSVLLGPPAEQLLNLRFSVRTSAWVFPGHSPKDQPRERMQGFWRKIVSKARLPADFRLHDLRHTFASVSLMEGETIQSTGELLGHRDRRSTTRYAHLRSDFLQKAAESIGCTISTWLGNSE